jgi:hypothetical protein
MRAASRGLKWKVSTLHVTQSGFLNTAGIGTSTGIHILPSRSYMELCSFTVNHHEMSYIMLDPRICGAMLHSDHAKPAFFALRRVGIDVVGGYEAIL